LEQGLQRFQDTGFKSRALYRNALVPSPKPDEQAALFWGAGVICSGQNALL